MNQQYFSCKLYFNYKICKQGIKPDSGAILALGAIVLFALLLALGMGIDAGNLFLAKERLQRATDAAALKGIELVGTMSDNQAKATSAQIAANNISKDITKMNIDAWNPLTAITTQIISSTSTVFRVDGQIDVKPFLMRSLGVSPNTYQITATSIAQRNKVAVSLVLDISDSMDCPADGSLCYFFPFFDCQATPNLSSCKPTKLDHLKVATKQFLQQLAGVSYLSIVTFNSNVAGFYSGDIASLDINSIDTLVADGGTNIAGGLNKATNDLLSVSGNPQKYIILVSDGAPTAGNKACLTGAFDDRGRYIKAIDESNTARTNGIIVHSIGIGVPEGIIGDPYEDVTAQINLKPVLLRRISNDSASVKDTQFPIACVPSSQNEADYGNIGTYLETPDPENLSLLFGAIKRNMIPRLTSPN